MLKIEMMNVCVAQSSSVGVDGIATRTGSHVELYVLAVRLVVFREI
jgi:hypothetical protein